MEKKTLTYSHKIFKELSNEYETEIFVIGDFDYVVDGALVTHISLNENGDAMAIASTNNGDAQFWDYEFEQLALTKSQWDDIVDILEDML